MLSEGEDAEGDAQGDLDEDEGELDPEGDAEDAVLSVLDTKALIFPADEDGRDHVASHEQKQENIMQGRMPHGVEDTEADEADSSDDGKDD